MEQEYAYTPARGPLRVHLNVAGDNLGIVIVGGTHVDSSEGDFGIFIKKILPGKLAESDGQLRVGDQLMEVNGNTLVGVSNARAVEILKACTATGEIELLVARDTNAQREFKKLSTSLMKSPLQITPTIERRKLVHQESSSSLGTVSDTSTQDSADLLNSDREEAIAVNAAVKSIMTTAATTVAATMDPVNISDVAVTFPGSEVDQTQVPPLPTSSPPLTPDKTTPEYYDNSVFTYTTPAPSKLTTATKPPSTPSTDIYHLPQTQQKRTRQTGQVGVGQYSRRWSIEPDKKIKLEKLIWALEYIGKSLTQEQKDQVYRSLDIDKEGRVTYADFLQLVKEMFSSHLESTQIQEKLLMALSEKLTMDLPQIPKILQRASPPSAEIVQHTMQSSSSSISPTTLDAWEQEIRMEDLTAQVTAANEERDAAQFEVAKLRKLLRKKEERCAALEQVAQSSEQRRKRAEADAAASKRLPQPALTTDECHKKLAVKGCELRKGESTIRRYKVATEKLLKFVEDCHEALVNSPGADTILYHRRGVGESVVRGDPVSGNPRPPPYLSNHAKVTSTKLAQEAKETVMAVRKIISVKELPFGWEEKLTEEGEKFYVNHQDQVTSWEKPPDQPIAVSISAL